MDTVSIKQPKMIPVVCIHPRNFNPNEMSEEKFSQLVEKIREEGFREPVKVCPASPEDCAKNESWSDQHTEHYWLWAGEHRWRAARILDMSEIPAHVDDWDVEKQKIKMVQDNLVSGRLDPIKFTELVKSIDHSFDVNPIDFGFADQQEMQQYLVAEKSTGEKDYLDGYLEAANKQREAVDSITDIVASIFSQTADTIDQSYLLFTYKGQTHCVVLCDKKCRVAVEDMVTHLQNSGADINDFMTTAIQSGLIQEG